MDKTQFVRPREKLQQKGARSLSNAELLQVVIGSGNAQIPVNKIAKKVAKILEESGSAVHPQELLAVQGMGNVKAGQILAFFELAARFPTLSSGDVFESKETLSILYQDLKNTSRQIVLYVSFDGACRLIKKRTLTLDDSTSTAKQVQRIFADCLTDSATTVLIAIGYNKQPLQPEFRELGFVRDIYKTSKLLAIPVRQFVLVSKEGETILKESSL